jgi:pyrophosphatase PpaX
MESESENARRWRDGWRPATWLFDFDGTLVDSVELMLASFRHAAVLVLGAAPPDEELRRGIGRPLIDQMRALDSSRADQLFDAYLEHNLAHHADLLRPYPGVDQLLDTLSATGRRLGIVTSKRRDSVEMGIELLGIDAEFAAIVTWEDTARHKPAPDPVLRALELLDADPGDAMYIGDSAWDIRAGRAAGVVTAAALWGAAPAQELIAERPDLAFAAAGELAA